MNKSISKVAINSQTFRVVFSDGKMKDYHVKGMASSLLLGFLNGSNFDLSKYESVDVKENDEFSWKSNSDGSGNIKFVDKSDVKAEQANMGRSNGHYGYGGILSITRPLYRPSPPPRPVPPPRPTYENQNRDIFKKLFGGA